MTGLHPQLSGPSYLIFLNSGCVYAQFKGIVVMTEWVVDI
jgi:hypothetical protein